ncbi:MAG: putative DNA binding domain-containing protein [Lachnospiraceae bacterium]|nr:putative DNA binding domain-containing protein [Lachnospiraceae bacterium]
MDLKGAEMKEIFDLAKFDSYKEDNRREVKKAEGGLPNSLWDTYSAFANCYGGVIILGVKEDKNGGWHTTGLKNASKLKKDFWDTINNRKKVSLNLLKDDDVETFLIDDTGDIIMVIGVPCAKREQKPIYINDDLFGGTFRRNWEGDYHCTRLQVKTMLRDQLEETMDMEVLDEAEIKDLNMESIRGYRNSHKSLKPGHPFERLEDTEYLKVIGAAGLSKEDQKLHPTAAGMLMFGNEYDIVRYFPEYFLDYRENPNTVIRWTDRLQSSSGEWSGNLFDFYFRVYNKIVKDIKIPFQMQGGFRVDDTSVHRALREALANCIINADFYGKYGIIIIKEENKLILENPGYIRLGKGQMRQGGKSDPRNKNLMKMFNMIDIGEHAGSGVPNIFNVWEEEGWEEPIIEESFDPDRTSLILKFVKKQAIKTSDKKQAIKTSDKKQAIKTSTNMEKIRLYLREHETAKAKDIAEILGLSVPRTRAMLSEMYDVEAQGANRTRVYRLKK